jgi:hypothetical protein
MNGFLRPYERRQNKKMLQIGLICFVFFCHTFLLVFRTNFDASKQCFVLTLRSLLSPLIYSELNRASGRADECCCVMYLAVFIRIGLDTKNPHMVQ